MSSNSSSSIGIGSMTVVLLTGFFTGAVLVLQTGITLDSLARDRLWVRSSARRWSRNSGQC